MTKIPDMKQILKDMRANKKIYVGNTVISDDSLRFTLERYVQNHTLKELYRSHTRHELATMLRFLEPYLLQQSEYACRSMTKVRMLTHLKYIANLHHSDSQKREIVMEELKWDLY